MLCQSPGQHVRTADAQLSLTWPLAARSPTGKQEPVVSPKKADHDEASKFRANKHVKTSKAREYNQVVPQPPPHAPLPSPSRREGKGEPDGDRDEALVMLAVTPAMTPAAEAAASRFKDDRLPPAQGLPREVQCLAEAWVLLCSVNAVLSGQKDSPGVRQIPTNPNLAAAPAPAECLVSSPGGRQGRLAARAPGRAI